MSSSCSPTLVRLRANCSGRRRSGDSLPNTGRNQETIAIASGACSTWNSGTESLSMGKRLRIQVQRANLMWHDEPSILPLEMLKSIKLVSLKVLRAGGAFDLVRDSAWRRKRLLILCYHGISLESEHLWRPRLYI